MNVGSFTQETTAGPLLGPKTPSLYGMGPSTCSGPRPFGLIRRQGGEYPIDLRSGNVLLTSPGSAGRVIFDAFDMTANCVASMATPASRPMFVGGADLVASGLVYTAKSTVKPLPKTVSAFTNLSGAGGVIVLGYASTGFAQGLKDASRVIEGELAFEELWRAFVGAPATPDRLRPKSRAFAAFSDVRKWFALSSTDAADLIGVRRTTPNAWEREGREPRARAARRLYHLHAIASPLLRRIGQPELIRWFEGGDPSPRQLLERGEVDRVARLAEAILIGSQPLPGPRPGAYVEPSPAPAAPVTAVRRRRTPRQRGEDGMKG